MLAIYSNNEVVGLHNNQKALIEKCQNLEEEIVDLKQNISYYQSVIEQCKQTIAENKDEYNLAKSRKPSRPLFITNILTFGNAKSIYNRKISEWVYMCKPVIDNYENLLTEIVVDSKELAQCQAEYSNKLKELQQTQKSLKNIVAQIKKCISVDENIKARISSHLKDLILLLKTAKYIISESLSKDLTKKVCIQEISLVELSENEKTAISKYTQSICKEFKEDPVVARYAEILTKEDEELNIMVGAYNQTVDNVASLIQTSIELDSMLKQHELADVEYDKQLSDIQTKYQLIMSQVDDKSNILKKAIAKINTADKFDDIKQGLISLANNDNASLSDEDIMNFLNDNKTLTI
jgi:peptidoglycan hydrolase CwlO-like protein